MTLSYYHIDDDSKTARPFFVQLMTMMIPRLYPQWGGNCYGNVHNYVVTANEGHAAVDDDDDDMMLNTAICGLVTFFF